MKTTRLIYFSAFLLMSLTSLQAAPLQTVQEKIKDLNTRKVPAAEQITAMEQLLADKEIQADQAAQKNVIATIDNNCNQIFNQMATDFRNNKTSYLEQIKGYNEFQKTFAKYASPLVTNKINYELNRCYENMINEQFDKLYKDKNKSFREIVQILKKILEDHPDLNKHARARFHLYRLIMQSCFPSGWTLIHRFDYTIADTELKPIVDKVLSDPELNAGNRNLAAGMYINYLCGKERFDEAEEFARKMLDQPDMTNADKAQTYVNLSEVYRHRRNFDKAMVYIKEAIKYDAVLGKKAGTNLALKFNKP